MIEIDKSIISSQVAYKFTGTLVAVSIILEFGAFGVAQGQESIAPISPSDSQSTTALQSGMCDPSNPKLKFVNTTESKACGLPISVPSANTTLSSSSASSSSSTSNIAPQDFSP
jgi:hypothetical protein